MYMGPVDKSSSLGAVQKGPAFRLVILAQGPELVEGMRGGSDRPTKQMALFEQPHVSRRSVVLKRLY